MAQNERVVLWHSRESIAHAYTQLRVVLVIEFHPSYTTVVHRRGGGPGGAHHCTA